MANANDAGADKAAPEVPVADTPPVATKDTTIAVYAPWTSFQIDDELTITQEGTVVPAAKVAHVGTLARQMGVPIRIVKEGE